jgi:hypothetical protein
VYLAQQVHQFRLRGEEFAMQHLGTEDELKHVLREILATMSPKERLEGLSEEDILRGLTPEQLERVRQLVQQPRPTEGDSGNPR